MCAVFERELVPLPSWSTLRAWLLLGGLGVATLAIHLADDGAGLLSLAVLAGSAVLLALSIYSERLHVRRARARLIDRAGVMLRHEINNQLQVVMAHLEEGGNAADQARVRATLRSVQRVADILNELSLERVRAFDPDRG